MDSTPSDAKRFASKAIVKKSFIPKSLSVIDMMKLGKLNRSKERSSAKVLIEKFNMENNEWSVSKEVIFEIEDKAFAEGGFRMAYKAKSDDESFRGNTWVVKKYNASSKETFEKMEKPVNHNHEELFKRISWVDVSFSKAVLKVCENFDECFYCNLVYFGKIDHKCVTVEEFLPGDFQKYINNNGSTCLNDLDITEKAETFVHYTYEKSNNRLMITDLQGVGYQLCVCYLEIAAQTIVEEKSDKSRMLVEYLFCAGNLLTAAFENFDREHVCNEYCTKLELSQL